MLHDIGKLSVPDAILLKRGELDDDEREQMRTHALAGAAILRDSDSRLLQVGELVARTHHERWDGSGYPAGLRGEEIPLEGRIAAICDVFDALVSERPYKRSWSVDEAITEVVSERGRHFDPALVDAFAAMARRAARDVRAQRAAVRARDRRQRRLASRRNSSAQLTATISAMNGRPQPSTPAIGQDRASRR